MNANQPAWCSGECRCCAMIVFTDIDPGLDGSFSINFKHIAVMFRAVHLMVIMDMRFRRLALRKLLLVLMTQFK